MYYSWFNIILVLSVVVYFIFDYFEEKHVKDEREEFIKLKTYEFVQKVYTFVLMLLAIAYLFIPHINGKLILFILIVSSLYTEMAAKQFFRNRL